MTEQVDNFNYDQFYIDFETDASAAEDFGSKAQFGKFTLLPSKYVHWIDKQPNEVDAETYGKLASNERSMEFTIKVDIEEFKPDLGFTYERPYINMSSADWRKTIKPSIEKAMGKGSMSKGKFGTTLQKLNGSYVEVHDVPQQDKDEYNTAKLVKVFKSRDECFAAWQKRFGGSEGGSSTTATSNPDTPPGYDADTWNATKPEIIAALAEGKTPKEVADDYGVPVSFVVALK